MAKTTKKDKAFENAFYELTSRLKGLSISVKATATDEGIAVESEVGDEIADPTIKAAGSSVLLLAIINACRKNIDEIESAIANKPKKAKKTKTK